MIAIKLLSKSGAKQSKMKFKIFPTVAALIHTFNKTTVVAYTTGGGPKEVYIALGSNLGDRAKNIHSAVHKLRSLGSVKRTSLLYETKPMYYAEQDLFLNAACLLETKLEAWDLLDQLKRIEKDLGRIETFKNGPRIIDLDVLLYGKEIISSNHLVVPHPRIAERAFVLKPLCDILPKDTRHPHFSESFASMLAKLPASDVNSLHHIVPLLKRPAAVGVLTRSSDPEPLIMGILNVTPDSFSDGGKYVDVKQAVSAALQLIQDGADIIDIGGESTRPGAAEIDVEEEIRRTIPVIKAIKDVHKECIISIDTRKSAVAQAAIEANAEIVNDVSGGRFDPSMLEVVKTKPHVSMIVGKLGCPVILMHSRGVPATMTGLTTYENGVITGVCREMTDIFQKADEHIPRWLQIADFGIGFAKTSEQNFQILNPSNMKTMKANIGDRPLLVGVSRKRFLGMGEFDNMEVRDWGTAGACSAAVLGGANILRVHNVKGIRSACRVFRRCIEGM